MKKFKDLGLQISEKEYRSIDKLSYSFLSTLDREGPQKALLPVKTTIPMIKGTIVDEKMDGSFDILNYHVAGTAPTGKIKDVVDLLIEIVTVEPEHEITDLFFFKDLIVKIFTDNKIEFWEKKTIEWRADKVAADKSAFLYFKDLWLAKGKILVTADVLEDAERCASILRTSEFTKDLFKPDGDGIESCNQFKFMFAAAGEIFKVMLDRVIIDHNKKVIKPYDVKTTSSKIMDFENSFFFYRYDIQALLYRKAMTFIAEKFYPSYTVDEFKFIVVSTTEFKSLVWKCPNNLLLKVTNGYVRNNKKVKGVIEILKDYHWYKDNGFNVDFPEEIYKNNGEVEIVM